MQVLDLFSGAGMFARAFTLEGFEIGAFCEIDPFCREVLRARWPGVPVFEDVRELTYDQLRTAGVARPDVITAGWPCQDFSYAGEQAGIKGDRGNLFWEIDRLASYLRPRYIVLENVTALLTSDGGDAMRAILGALATLGYDAEWHVIRAGSASGHVSAGAPHSRERLFIVAHSDGQRLSIGQHGRRRPGAGEAAPAAPLHAGHQGASEAVAHAGGARDSSGVSKPQQRQEGHAEEPDHRGDRPGRGQAGSGGAPAQQVGLLAHGIAARLVRHSWPPEPRVGRVTLSEPDRAQRLRALGNGLVVPVARAIAGAIQERELPW